MLFSITHVDSAIARDLIAHAIDEAAENGWNVAVSVVDAAGATLASSRMNGVAAEILGFAEDKAYTASTMRRDTASFFERMDKSASLRLGLSNRERLLVWGGGLPIKYEGIVVGAIGVSGAQDFEDVACAQAALRKAGLS